MNAPTPFRVGATLQSDLVDRVLDLFLGVADLRLHLARGLVGRALVAQVRVAHRLARFFLDIALGLFHPALDLVLVHVCTFLFSGDAGGRGNCCPLRRSGAIAAWLVSAPTVARRRKASLSGAGSALIALLRLRLDGATHVERGQAELQDDERPRARVPAPGDPEPIADEERPEADLAAALWSA